ncbi:MAG TPA: fibronectin type III domain-containing protein, partial [Candidatus Dormibacteraeota bacterium]|nr:fibronectin type III domain-containing protein [Candidatus Dormibacteraeota bacterium]
MLVRTAWKPALGLAILALLISTRSVNQPQAIPHVAGRNAAATSVPCTPLPSGVTTWDATGSPYILPTNDTNIDPSACVGGIVVPFDATLVIDGSKGPVLISSHGASINVQGGELKTTNTDATNTVRFVAEPDVASWDGISITADAHRKGDASLSFVSIQSALNAIRIDSGATSSPDGSSYGLTVRNSGIGPSYFDGIDAKNTPISVTGLGDGKFGTLNNIGSQGINVTFDTAPVLTGNALEVKGMSFGSSVPFDQSTCPQPPNSCVVTGSIGNNAILATFVANQTQPVVVDGNSFFRAGSFGIDLENAKHPQITNNTFDCNGSGNAKPVVSCVGALPRFSAVYLNNVTADLLLGQPNSGVSNNKGHQNGLDAIVVNGTITSDLTWKTPTNDPSVTDPPHDLGYMVANGDLNLVNSTKLIVGDQDVVKVKGGSITLTGGTLDAHNSDISKVKTFTSLRDKTVGLDACGSVFAPGCPVPLPAGEWGGIDLVGAGANGTIENAQILYATKGVQIANGASHTLAATYGPNFGLVIRKSHIGPSFSDSVSAVGTPIALVGNHFDCPAGACTGPSAGDHGVLADFTGSTSAIGGGLRIDANTFVGSVNEAIRGVALGSQTVVVTGNTVKAAGAFGIKLEAAKNPTLTGNAVSSSGTGSPTYSAIYLPDVTQADFNSGISGNTGSGNGLDAIAFHGTTGQPLTWKTIGASSALGYLVDGNLTVNGALTLASGDYAPVLGGSITVKTGAMKANGAVLTSLKEQATHVPSCGSVFVPKVSGVCPAKTAGDWGGLILDPGQANLLTGSEIRYATTGISMDKPPATPAPTNLVLVQTNIRNTSADGITTRSPLSVTQGAFTNLLGHGIALGLSAAGSGAALTLDRVAIGTTGAEGVLATGLAGQLVSISGVTVDRAGAFGINLKDADDLTLTNNTVTNSATGDSAIYLNGFTGEFAKISGNKGAGNGLDALAFHGTVTDNLIWRTARQTGDPTKPLGYVLDNTLNMQPGHTLTVNAGDIVKVGNGGTLNLQGVNLKADDTGSSSQKIFTSLADNSAGVAACPSALLPGCGTAAAGDWGGINLWDAGANGTLVNSAVRYAATGISITSGATSTYGSSSFGLVVSRSMLGPTKADGIASSKTAISITNSTISTAVHGISVDLTSAPGGTALRLSGNRFTSTSAEAILGQALGGQPVWITDNHVQGASTFGIRLLNANELVLRDNNVSASGGGPNAGAAGYPAIYLNGVTADFTRNVRGNVGSGNGLDVMAFHGTANGDLSWRTPTVNTSTGGLGYVLDGSLTVNAGTLTVHPGDVVKSLGGPITISGGTLDASNTDPAIKLFTSLKDQTAYPQTCPSILTGQCASGPQQGDWGGIVITNDTSGQRGTASIANGQLSFTATALSIDSGPAASFGTSNFGLIVKGSTISDTTGDGINAQDTPISVTTTSIRRVGVHGVVATFFGGTPCISACGTSLDLEHVSVTTSSKDGIVASGLGGRPTIVSDNIISGAGTYGIRLAGADQLTMNQNTVSNSGGPATTFRYPAIYLSGVKADFELKTGTSTVAGNHGSGNGIDAMVIHGEASQPLTWLTTGVTAQVVVPPVPADHFGYMLDGGLTVDGMLTTNTGDVVKVLGGAIQVNGSLVATGTTFTSLKDGGIPIKVCDAGYDSVFIQRVSGSCPAAASGDWAGITASGASTLTSTTIGFDDGLTVTGGALQFAGGAMHDIARNAIVVSGSPLSVTHVAFSRVGNDGIDSTNSGSMDIITDNQFDHIGGIAINLKNSPADLERNVFTNDANPTVKTTGAAVSLQCSSIQSGGITGDAGLIVKESDFAAGVGVTAPAGASVENNWWGHATGPSGQLSGGVTVSTYFTTQNPTATIAITGKPSATQPLDPVKSDFSLGTGLVQGTLTFSRNMNPEASLPSVSYASSPVSFTGAWKPNDPRTWIGTAPIDSSLAANGTHTVSASGAHDCVPDLAHNLMTPASKTFAADTTTLPTVSVSAPDLVGASSARLHGHIGPAGWATGAVQSGQFVVANLVFPFDQHSYATPPLADKTTPLDFSLIVTGLNQSSTYAYQLQVPSVNGTATEPTFDTVTTTAPASKVLFTSSPPASVRAGTLFSAAASTEDPSGNVVSDFAGTVSVALTAANGATLSGTMTQSVVHGVAMFSDLSVNKTGIYTLTATSTPSLTSAVSNSFTVTPGALDHFTVASIATQTAGTPFQVQATAYDALSNVKTDYAGGATVAGSAVGAPNTAPVGCGGTCPPSYGAFGTWTNGVASANVTLYVAEINRSLTVADGTHAGTSNSFGIGPPAASTLVVTGYPTATAAGSSQNFTVTALDPYSNTATGYGGMVDFTSSDTLAALPGDSTMPGGTKTFAATLNTGGTQSLTATDTLSVGITGTESGIAVTPRAPMGLTATTNGTAEIDLSWTASPGATGYNLKRSTTSGGPYSQVGGTPTTATASYHDTGLSAGTSYYYVVQAVGTAG